mmetsp:Transcript_34424/g.83770  ORF Transcript_34424/g.83770 Transcript_34424/m.83770 type:complete len:294 (-) Transcript_34424:989-1870(-)
MLLAILEKLLLRPNHGARPANPQPRNRLPRTEALMLHHVQRNQRPRASQPSLAVHRNHASLLVADVEKLPHNMCRGGRAVLKLEVVKIEARLLEMRLVIRFRLVEANNGRDIHVLEDLHILAGCEGVEPRCNLCLFLRRPLEANKLWRQPVQVAIEGVVPMLILLQAKFAHVEPSNLHCLFEAQEAVEDIERKRGRVDKRRVPVAQQGRGTQAPEGPVGLERRHPVAQYQISTQQEGRVGPRGRVIVRVVDNGAGAEARVRVLFVHVGAEAPHDGQVDRAKVCAKVLVPLLQI